MSLQIDYILLESGWAFVKFDHDGHHVESHVSYLEDSLPQLARIALAGFDLENPRVERSVEFADEPGGIRLRFQPLIAEPIEQRPSPNEQLLNIRYESIEVDGSGTLLFEGTTTAAELATVVLGVLEGIYDQFGVIEYQRRWIEGEFPASEMVRLRHVLGLPPMERRLW